MVPIAKILVLAAVGVATCEAATSSADLLLLFHRPAEPVFTLRGVNRDAAFDVPVEYLPEQFKNVSDVIASTARGSGVRLIPVAVYAMPEEDFADIPAVLPYRNKYSHASPIFLDFAVRFETFFTNSTDNDELLARGVWALLHYNPEMVLDGLRNALVRRPGAQQFVQMLDLPQYFPETFVDDVFIARARREMYLLSESDRRVITVFRNETQTTTVESKVWYWLEDTLRTNQHTRWHINYPTCCDTLAASDRHGELFVYFHRQMLARYNAERLTNGGSLVQALQYWNPIKESHFPKMFNIMRSKGYVGRQANTSLTGDYATLQLFDTWIQRYRDALELGSLLTAEGELIPLAGIEGLDLLSDQLEYNGLTAVNVDFYGNLHGFLHLALGVAHDTIGIDNEEDTSAMSSIVSVISDPVFFLIHQLLDDLFEEYKQQYLEPYTQEELTWGGITVEGLSVTSLATGAANELHTYWQESDLDVSLGLDYTPPGRVYGRFRHLQYETFQYNMQIRNPNSTEERAFVRLFLMIEEDANGQPLDAASQQRYAIEMDRFDATLLPGINEVTRSSTASSVTINADVVYGLQQSASEAKRSNHCRCGWPQNLLVPRGTAEGTPYRLVVVVTDYAEDKAPSSVTEICHDGWSLCGVPGSLYYPDKKPMGYPFDRAYRADVADLDAFLTANMAAQSVVIKFDDTRIDAPGPLLKGDASTTWMPSP